MSVTDPFLLLPDILSPPEWVPDGDRPDLLPHQIEPGGSWYLWILFGGRGSGKTEGACRAFLRRIHAARIRARIIGPTLGDVIDSCVEGPSGILAMDHTARFQPSHPGGARIVWPNGSVALLIGTPTPRDVDRLRAKGNVHLDWWEELASNPQIEKAWTQAQFGNRLGPHPLAIASTTPRVRKHLSKLIAMKTTATTVGRIHDNPHIAPDVKQALIDAYAGSTIGRQELDGELLKDVTGALWKRSLIEEARALWLEKQAMFGEKGSPPMSRIVVAVDPPGSEEGAEAGIVVVGRSAQDDRIAAVLADRSIPNASPAKWGQAALDAYAEFEADAIVAEVNQGGDMVRHTLATVEGGKKARIITVRASRGKVVRAEPVVAMYEQGRAMHGEKMPELEEQMATWTNGDPSPDRIDALVWGVTEVMGLHNKDMPSPLRAA